MPGSGTLLTFPLLCQLSIILHDNICWEDFKQLHSYKPDGKLSEATAISKKITSVHGVTVLFIFGKIVETGEDAIFGAFISEPSKDGSSIQPRKDEHDDLLSCFLFELSPIHDVSWGNVGRPGWSATGDGELCFGENGNGAALVLGKRLKTASLIRTVEQQDPSFTANAWRGKTSVQLDVEAIELWAELSPYQDDESDYDDSGYDGSSYVGSSYDDSSYDDSSNDDSGSSDSGDDDSSDDGSD